MKRTWWREPLVHFAVVGALVFAIERATAQPEAEPPIVISEDFVAALEQENRQRSGRDADRIERAGLIARFVREEALFREASRLGLDRGDVIVRRRLIQKMEFLLRGGVDVPEPTDDELEQYLAEHRAELARGPRVEFTHVFFSRGEEPRATEVLATLDPEVRRADERDKDRFDETSQPVRRGPCSGSCKGRSPR